MKVRCLHCNLEFETKRVEFDRTLNVGWNGKETKGFPMGWYSNCPNCRIAFDVDTPSWVLSHYCNVDSNKYFYGFDTEQEAKKLMDEDLNSVINNAYEDHQSDFEVDDMFSKEDFRYFTNDAGAEFWIANTDISYDWKIETGEEFMKRISDEDYDENTK